MVRLTWSDPHCQIHIVCSTLSDPHLHASSNPHIWRTRWRIGEDLSEIETNWKRAGNLPKRFYWKISEDDDDACDKGDADDDDNDDGDDDDDNNYDDDGDDDINYLPTGCAEKEVELKQRNGRIEHLSSEISRMNRWDILDLFQKDMALH